MIGHRRRRQAQGGGRPGDGERAVGAGVAPDDVPQRIGDRLEEGRRDVGGRATPRPSRRRAASSTAAQWGVAGDGHRDGAAPGSARAARRSPGLRRRSGRPPPAAVSGPRRREQVGHPVGARDLVAGGEVLQFEPQRPPTASGSSNSRSSGSPSSSRSRVWSMVRAARPPLGRRGVVLVEVGSDEVEGEGRGEGAGPGRLDDGHLHPAGGDVGEHLLQGRKVEVLL